MVNAGSVQNLRAIKPSPLLSDPLGKPAEAVSSVRDLQGRDSPPVVVLLYSSEVQQFQLHVPTQPRPLRRWLSDSRWLLAGCLNDRCRLRCSDFRSVILDDFGHLDR
jgi:hypothetical protein